MSQLSWRLSSHTACSLLRNPIKRAPGISVLPGKWALEPLAPIKLLMCWTLQWWFLEQGKIFSKGRRSSLCSTRVMMWWRDTQMLLESLLPDRPILESKSCPLRRSTKIASQIQDPETEIPNLPDKENSNINRSKSQRFRKPTKYAQKTNYPPSLIDSQVKDRKNSCSRTNCQHSTAPMKTKVDSRPCTHSIWHRRGTTPRTVVLVQVLRMR